MCLRCFFPRFSELLNIRRNHIVTEEDYHKILVELSKTDKYREGSCVYIARTGNVTCPYAFLLKYLQFAGISPNSKDFIFRSLRYDKKTKGDVLSSKQLSAGRAREILKAKLGAIGVDPSRF